MKPQRKIFCYESETPWTEMAPGLKRQILGYDNQIMVVKMKAEKGAAAPTHSHFHAQSTFVASGRFEFTVNGQTQVVGPGDGIYVEPNAVHCFVCLEPGIIVDNFSPMREDFV